MIEIAPLAPCGPIVDYDRYQLTLYANLLVAADSGDVWRETARSLMGLDIGADGAKACWQSHLERARWIYGAGLDEALTALERSPPLLGFER